MFIIEISLCGSVSACQINGEEIQGQLLNDLMDCNASGDCEPACQYILDEYKPEFRIVRQVDGEYKNVIASKEEKNQVCREIYGTSKGENNELYLVWQAAAEFEN